MESAPAGRPCGLHDPVGDRSDVSAPTDHEAAERGGDRISGKLRPAEPQAGKGEARPGWLQIVAFQHLLEQPGGSFVIEVQADTGEAEFGGIVTGGEPAGAIEPTPCGVGIAVGRGGLAEA